MTIGIDHALRTVFYGWVKYVFPFLATVLLAACGRDDAESVWWKNRTTIIELEQHLELARYRLQVKGAAEAERETPPDRITPEALSEGITSMAARKDSLVAEISVLREGWDSFRRETLQSRRAAAAADFPGEFRLPDGRVLYGARITAIDDGGVSVAHQTGAARLRIGDLDESQRIFFGLDGELAELALAREREQRIAYERWHEERQAENEEESRKLAAARRDEESRRESARLVAAASRTVAVSSPLANSIGALGETGRVYGSSYRYRRYHTPRSYVRYHYYQPAPARCSTGVPFWGSNSPFRRPCQSYAAPGSVTSFRPFGH